MTDSVLSFIYGLCVMFFFMMAWQFWRKGNDRISRLMTVLMLLIGFGYLKDLPFSGIELYLGEYRWDILTSIDMVAVPFYGFILTELCRPGYLTRRMIILNLLPFIVLPVLLLLTDMRLFYYMELAWAGIYGICYVVWVLLAIPRYHKILRENYSYSENLYLGWLRVIMVSFFVILGLWIVNCILVSPYIDSLYMLGSLAIWGFICYFIHKHESVMEGLKPLEEETEVISGGISIEDVVTELFIGRKLYLNPKLKLTDVAQMVGTNRTYLSNFFNRKAGATFYDYVNALRLDHAEKLLEETSDSQAIVAEKSGFNSLSTFRRAFEQRHHCSPAQYREHIRKG